MTTEDLIRAALVRCERVVAGVAELRPFLDPVLPASGDELTRATAIERIASVALLKRYEQLQDLLGRLWRAYLAWEAEDVRAMSRRDQANQLEKYRIIDDADRWIAAAELRNRLVHEYPVDEAEQVDRVNQCWGAIDELIGTYRALAALIVDRGLSL